jgi:hypothetical protein
VARELQAQRDRRYGMRRERIKQQRNGCENGEKGKKERGKPGGRRGKGAD